MTAPVGDAIKMLAALHGHAAFDHAWTEIRSIRAHGGALKQAFLPTRDIEDIAASSMELRDAANVYFSVSPRMRPEGTKQAVELMPAVWADIDSTDALIALVGFELEPSAVVASGRTGGHHAYWILKEPIDVATGETLNAALARLLTSDPAVKDAGRILRLPGTLNHKTTPPHEVKLVELNDRRYDREDLIAATTRPDSATGEELTRVGGVPTRAPSRPVARMLSKLELVRAKTN